MAKSLFEQIVDRSLISITEQDLIGLTKIGYYALAGEPLIDDSVAGIDIPNTVQSIGQGGFSYSNLTSITIPNSVEDIQSKAFEGCVYLTSINLPNNLTTISIEVFYNCNKLSSISIPNSVTTIENNAFQLCSSLTSITIPQNVKNIGSGAFGASTGSMSIANAYFQQPKGMTVTLPTAGSSTGMFYVKTARNMNVYTDNETIKNYAWSSDNITATFYHLNGTAW